VPITDDIIESCWRTIGALNEIGIRRLQRSSGKAQEELMTFLIAWNSDQRREVVELALYLGLVIVEAFSRTVAVRRVSEEDILRLLSTNQKLIAGLPESLEEGVALLTSPEYVSEPAIMRYILSALAEASDDPEDSVELSDDEFWHLVLVLKTCSDALHEASAPKT